MDHLKTFLKKEEAASNYGTVLLLMISIGFGVVSISFVGSQTIVLIVRALSLFFLVGSIVMIGCGSAYRLILKFILKEEQEALLSMSPARAE